MTSSAHRLRQLSLAEVCAWLCLFIQESRGISLSHSELQPPEPSAALQDVISETMSLADHLQAKAARWSSHTTSPFPFNRLNHPIGLKMIAELS